MIDLTPQAFALLRRQHGHASVRQLADAGVGLVARRRLIETGALVAVHRSVLRISSAPVTFEGRCVALCLAHPSGFITGPSAGRLLGLRRLPPATPIRFCMPHGIHLFDPGVSLRQSRKVSELDVVHLPNGIVMATAPRLAFDLAGELSPVQHASLVEQLIVRKLCTMQTLGAAARRLCHPCRPGSEQFARTLLGRRDGLHAGSRTGSRPDLVLGDALRAKHVPVGPDLAVPRARWRIELDADPGHLRRGRPPVDRRRDVHRHPNSWEIERVTEIDLLDVDGLVGELVASYWAQRGRAA